MKRKLKNLFITLIICISIGVFCITANAEAIHYSAVTNAENQTELTFEYYTNSKGEAYLAGFEGETIPETVVFPSEIDGVKIKGINKLIIYENGDGQYTSVDLKGIKHLVISEGIEEINCILTGKENLETVKLPTTLARIVSDSFRNAEKLTSINLENVRSIGHFTFYNCKSLKYADLSSAEKIGMDTFGGTDGLTIRAKYNSVAADYAKDHGMFFIKNTDDTKLTSGITLDGNTYYGADMTAAFLSSLGLMRGVSTDENGKIDFDMNRTGTRVEAAVMLVRMLGKDTEAAALEKTHPFTDVPEWADGYISYAYEKGLVKGVSDTLFDSDSLMLPNMYLTFMLRVLGYSDSGENADFSWDDPWNLAMECGITPRAGYYQVFLRSEMADQTFCTLQANINGTETKLYEKMAQDGAFSVELWNHGVEILNKASVDAMNSKETVYVLK